MQNTRGSFIVFEGLDLAGKTTQIERLKEIYANDENVVFMRFPDRTTTTGKLIDAYLRETGGPDSGDSEASAVSDQVIHLLFSANRWEKAELIKSYINSGKTVICDRYAYSGVAYSVTKGVDFDWCVDPDRGLPRPDTVIFLDISIDDYRKRLSIRNITCLAERYEKEDFQTRTMLNYTKIFALDCHNRFIIDATKSVKEITELAVKMIDFTNSLINESNSPLKLLWE